ncbi:MAG: hypothetical protein HYU51_05000 [Candidatus Rokubacteria bacterium]|nr:hypothetical protein [Candidatus Rokubacteria bacterium]
MEWVKAALAAGLQVVAVTDHNAHSWVGTAQDAANGMGLTVFAGVEITVNGGIHMLAILPPGTRPDAVAALLGECKIASQTFATGQAISPLSFVEAATVIKRHGGLCLAAHADGEDGFLTVLVKRAAGGTTTGSETLRQIVTSLDLDGAEVCQGDAALLSYLDNSKQGYKRATGPLALLEGSDAHALADLGQRSTWIKMSRADLEGLRLALTDAEMSVRRAGTTTADPNAHSPDLIEAIEIERAQYIGNGGPLILRLNPWLNAIIGGHGTGKSTVVEFVRIAMRREDEVPPLLRDAFQKYVSVRRERLDDGLLRPETVLRVIFRRDGRRYRIQWSPDGAVLPIAQDDGAGGWVTAPGDVRSRFPVRIFSQKQIYTLAEDPNALLTFIDESPAVDAVSLRADMDREEKAFLSLRAQARAAEVETQEEVRLRGALDDVRRKLAVFETSDHREILRSYQVVERQQRAVDEWATGLEASVAQVERLAGGLVADELPAGVFPEPANAQPAEQTVLAAVAEATASLERLRAEAEALAAHAHEAFERFRAAVGAGAWPTHVAETRARYEELKRQLSAAGAGDPSEYGRLVQEQQTIESRLRAIEARKATARGLEQQATEHLKRLGALREELTSRRKQFLVDILAGNDRVRVDIVPYGDKLDAERRLREHISRTDQTFQDQIWSDDDKRGILRDLYANHSPALDAKAFADELTALKARLIAIAKGSDGGDLDGKFVAHLRRRPPEALDRIAALFPEDAVTLAYRTRIGEDFRPISQGSPGQKSAAVLAFVLSHGTEPLILDQPEDDLDNQLIAELIVTQLRQAKAKRQMLVVTHNPNIVVNGDAELVIPFVVRNGRTEIDGMGGLQEDSVRETICSVMEGGRDALDRRYRRIRGGVARA